jgi:hypothetical protein
VIQQKKLLTNVNVSVGSRSAVLAENAVTSANKTVASISLPLTGNEAPQPSSSCASTVSMLAVKKSSSEWYGYVTLIALPMLRACPEAFVRCTTLWKPSAATAAATAGEPKKRVANGSHRFWRGHARRAHGEQEGSVEDCTKMLSRSGVTDPVASAVPGSRVAGLRLNRSPMSRRASWPVRTSAFAGRLAP